MSYVVTVRDASIFQEKNPILSNVSFDMEKGEFVFLIGRNGTGKSSLLKTLYGDLQLRLGEAVVADFPIKNIRSSKIPYLRRKIGIVFQDFQLFQDRSIADNLTFVMKATGWNNNTKIKQRLSDVLMRVGLGSVANKYPYQISGGEQQRVAVARALINDPVVLFADEPTGNLDPEVANGIFKLFQEINRGGTAILMATHNYRFIKEFPGRILKCEDGKLLDSNKEKVDYFNIW